MLKPNDIHEASFVKAVFGGYDMQSVDDFLDQVAGDYQTIYNENLNLKQKLRLLVQKLEEYRTKEDSLNQAQLQAAAIIADAERKAAQTILSAAPVAPAVPVEPVAAPVEAAPVVDKAAYDAAVAEQEKRVENAKLVAENFISVMQTSISKHLDLLEELKSMPLEAKPAPYDYESEADPTPAAPAAAAEEDPVDEIARNVARFFGDEPANPDETKVMPKAKHFENLQFGKNYDPRA